jgi:hypothetical protein
VSEKITAADISTAITVTSFPKCNYRKTIMVRDQPDARSCLRVTLNLLIGLYEERLQKHDNIKFYIPRQSNAVGTAVGCGLDNRRA